MNQTERYIWFKKQQLYVIIEKENYLNKLIMTVKRKLENFISANTIYYIIVKAQQFKGL